MLLCAGIFRKNPPFALRKGGTEGDFWNKLGDEDLVG